MRYAVVSAVLLVIAHLFVSQPEPIHAPIAVISDCTEFDAAKYLQDVSVTIKSKASSGSGTLVKTKDGNIYALTCAHLVKHNRTMRQILAPDGTTRHSVSFEPLTILKVGDGKTGETYTCLADVVRYSDRQYGEDLALLRLRSKSYCPKNKVKFYLGEELVKLGTPLMHCGSWLGQDGSDSLSPGIMSKTNRLENGKVFDQITCTAFPGSSGGPVIIESNGRYVGMVVRGFGETYIYVVPTRRIYAWAKRIGVGFVLDDNMAIPSDKELMAGPMEEQVIMDTVMPHVHESLKDLPVEPELY